MTDMTPTDTTNMERNTQKQLQRLSRDGCVRAEMQGTVPLLERIEIEAAENSDGGLIGMPQSQSVKETR